MNQYFSNVVSGVTATAVLLADAHETDRFVYLYPENEIWIGFEESYPNFPVRVVNTSPNLEQGFVLPAGSPLWARLTGDGSTTVRYLVTKAV